MALSVCTSGKRSELPGHTASASWGATQPHKQCLDTAAQPAPHQNGNAPRSLSQKETTGSTGVQARVNSAQRYFSAADERFYDNTLTGPQLMGQIVQHGVQYSDSAAEQCSGDSQ